MESKRNQLMTYLQEAGLSPVMPGGGYFIVADISTLGKYQVNNSMVVLLPLILVASMQQCYVASLQQVSENMSTVARSNSCTFAT